MSHELTPERVRIALAERSYDILIAPDLLDKPESYAGVAKSTSALIVTNTTVGPLYAARLEQALRGRHQKIWRVELPDGEQFKTWESLNEIFDTLLARQADRHTLLYALGGGVVGDMSGFAAACFMRGVPFVQVPTTLLAQVDASVGGKTAINHPRGKNMIGAFYQPQAVICDLSTLKTLPQQQLCAGLAEVIKYGPIADMEFLAWIEEHIERLRACELQALTHAVRRCCEIKAAVVGADERESGRRAILNFGHTFGHAIEAGMGFGAWLHGQAVSAGMALACELSLELGLVDAHFVQRMRDLLVRAGLPVTAPILDPQDNVSRYLQLMQIDKKALDGQIRFILIDGKGQALLQNVPEQSVRAVLRRCCA